MIGNGAAIAREAHFNCDRRSFRRRPRSLAPLAEAVERQDRRKSSAERQQSFVLWKYDYLLPSINNV